MSDPIECPVCNGKFSASVINDHVEACLDKEDCCSAKSCNKTVSSVNREVDLEKEDQKVIPSPSAKSLSGCEVGTLAGNDTLCKSVHVNENMEAVPKLKSTKAKEEKCKPINAHRSIFDILGKRKYSALSKQPMNEEDRKRIRFPGKNSESAREKQFSLQNSNGEALVKTNGLDEREVKGFSPSAKTNSKAIDLEKPVPLAEQMRPISFDDYVGQDELIGENSTLRALLSSEKVPSFILWGPPGCGKTSLVNIIGSRSKTNPLKRLVKLSATASSLSDVKEAIKIAKNEYSMFKKETILFIDEIHRFNKLQQDFFLPFVENGTITLIGATTENPSFQVNGALLSRCKVIVLKKHSVQSLMKILRRAVEGIGGNIVQEIPEKCSSEASRLFILENALEALANLSDGDARSALNGLEMTINMKKSHNDNNCIQVSDVSSILQRNHILYDKKGEQHFNLISAFHKSIRGSDDSAALYWLSRMLIGGEDPLYIARRMIRIASEDIGIADNSALSKAVSTHQACHFIGMPECEVNLAHMAVYLARAPKSVEIYKAYNAAKNSVLTWKGPLPGVPLHLRNAPTKLMKELGYAKGYKYNPDYSGYVEQEYLPSELQGTNFFETGCS
eukprot:gene1368-15773_t